MQSLTYYWINVFTTEQNKGNPLPVFVLKSPLSKIAMQQIATLMNQAETIFIEHAQSDQPLLHIYTSTLELPFAGHPIIGALQILSHIRNHAPVNTVMTQAGVVRTLIDENNIHWIRTPIPASMRKSTLDISLTAQMLNLQTTQILSEPTWIKTGNEQLIVQLSDPEAVDNIQMDIPLFLKHATLYEGRTIIYLWALDEKNNIYARYLYYKNGNLGEDSGTGSACANLGGYQVLHNHVDFEWCIRQACHIQKESMIFLKVTKDQEIWIGGYNRFMGQGELYWKDHY